MKKRIIKRFLFGSSLIMIVIFFIAAAQTTALRTKQAVFGEKPVRILLVSDEEQTQIWLENQIMIDFRLQKWYKYIIKTGKEYLS